MRVLSKHVPLCLAALLLGLVGCLETPPDGLADAPPPITEFQVVGRMASDGRPTIASGNFLNGASFQQDGLLTYKGYQYSAFWNAQARVVLVRRPTGDGAWQYLEMAPGYTSTSTDVRGTISLGISPTDGRLHIAFDHNASALHYVTSVAGLVASPQSTRWETASFGPILNTLGGQAINQVTYPRFLTTPGGGMLLSFREGTVDSGKEVLWEYNGTTATWARTGIYLAGLTENTTAYLHRLEFEGRRLHAVWSWRTTADPSTNQDLLYAFSDDVGRTWNGNFGRQVGITERSPITPSSDARVWAIGKNRGLMDSEHMIVDHTGRIHVLLSHMPDTEPDDADFLRARTKSQFFHYWRDINGSWNRQPTNINVRGTWRGKLAVSPTDNLYAVLPNIRIASASATSKWANWALIDVSGEGFYFSDPLIDRPQLLNSNRLTIYTPANLFNGVSNIFMISYTLY